MHVLAVLLAIALGASPSPLAPDASLDLCVPQLQLARPAACPPMGPGDYAVQLAAARMPEVVPDLPLEPLQRYDPVVPFTYARVSTPNLP